MVDLAVEFNLNDDILWDKIIGKSYGDIEKVATILQFSDIYKEPARFIDALDDDVEIE